ncbi:MAG: hypothetical protein NTV74_00575 [Euryarchaeota archaeon]|nr:hypothetical protein [Euryarchaeota archaeon]
MNLMFLAMFSLLLIKFSNYGKSLAVSPKKFVKELLVISVLVTIIGAAIDQLIVIKPLYYFGTNYYSSNPDFTANPILLIVALGIIFLSVVLPYIQIIKMKMKYSFIIGFGMVCINIIFWYFNRAMMHGDESYILLTYIMFYIVVMPLILIIVLLSLFKCISKVSR